MEDVALHPAVAQLRAAAEAIAALVPAEQAGWSDAELLAVFDALGVVENVVAAAGQQVVTAVEARGVPATWGFPTVAAMVAGRWRWSPRAAAARVYAAAVTTTRTTLTGETVPPKLPATAAAQTAGRVTADHVRIIADVTAKIPGHVDPGEVEVLEKILLQAAETADPATVAKAGRVALAYLDPDGAEPRDDAINRHRTFSLRQRSDGMGVASGLLTPEALAALEAVLSPLAAPLPATTDELGRELQRDTRTPGQRLHDALHDAASRLLRSGELPDSGGTPTSMVVHVRLEDLIAEIGHAHTDFGTTIPVARLLNEACEAEIVPVVLTETDGVLAYGTTRRIATPAQTRALRARDRGCSFPGCTRPPEWCQRHHVREVFADDGETDVDNLTLVCGHHHRTFHRYGWDVTMVDGRPWWIPPEIVDPLRRPLRNTTHDDPVPSSGLTPRRRRTGARIQAWSAEPEPAVSLSV